jgi:ribosomal protein S18 acetylase RimI-like enzyme
VSLQSTHVDEIVVRDATIDDAPALALIAAATFLDAYANMLPGDAIVAHCALHHTPEAFAQYLSEPQTQAWLAVTSTGTTVGYAMNTTPDLPLDDLATDDIELKRIYLLSRFHGIGIGQRLMDAASAGARAAAARRLLLGVYAENPRALAFYRRNGFAQTGTRQFTVGHLVCDDYVLAKVLS